MVNNIESNLDSEIEEFNNINREINQNIESIEHDFAYDNMP